MTAGIPVERLVFLDESSASLAMARLYGRSLVGERLRGSAPAGRWKACTMLSGIRLDGPFAPALIDGPVDGAIFDAWLEQFLIPSLRSGDVVIMDNLSTHRMAGVSKRLNEAGHEVLYLPAYSPDFNPIEKMWSQIKSYLRNAAARTWESLSAAMASALSAVTPSHCASYFGECGYRTN